jgi:peptidoglycan glycosyltransferase
VNGPLRRLATFLAVLFVVLLAAATYVQAIDARRLGHQQSNPRPLYTRFSQPRGDIRLADGTVVARSVPVAARTGDQSTYDRVYPLGQLFAHVTGWAGVSSTTGVEQAENDVLSGTDERLALRNLTDTLLGRQRKPGYIVLSLQRAAQEAATKALAASGRKGAVVALDPRTGAVLALVSLPSFDPQPLAGRSTKAVGAAYQALDMNPDRPLTDRATAERQPPGSLFKVVTAAAALSKGRKPDALVDSPPTLKLPLTNRTLSNFGGETCGAARITLAQALAISCNTAFAKLGLELGGDVLRAQAQAFGLGSRVDGFPLPQTVSVFPDSLDKPQTALSAIGQYDVALTPLNAAMVVAAVADGGQLLQPQLVAEEHGPDNATLKRAEPVVLRRAMSPEVAAQLTQMMVGVTTSGSAAGVFTALGVPVAGKTGTAQHGEGQAPHAWFGGFAPASNPRVAVAVFVEDGGNAGSEATGGHVAAPIAAAVMAAVLGR